MVQWITSTAQPVHMDVEKVHVRVPQGLLWGALWECGVERSFVTSYSVSVLSAVSQTRPGQGWCLLRWHFVTGSVHKYHGLDF